MRTVAIGPVRDLPSWHWIGSETAGELGRYYRVAVFAEFDRLPAAEIILLVKQRPPPAFVAAAQAAGSKLVFLPVDGYASEAALAADAPLLAACDLVLAHSEMLLPLLRPHCRRLGLVEHHGRDVLPTPAPWRERGPVLWVGGCQHVPHLLKWLDAHPLPCEVRIMTDLDDRRARLAAHVAGHAIGLSLAFGPGTINGHPAMPWSADAQQAMMGTCKAAIDIKGNDFAQRTKPPTKGQQFVASGIPFACNRDSATARYFIARGFTPAAPDDVAYWFSRDYWEASRQFAERLRPALTLTAVGGAYRSWIDRL